MAIILIADIHGSVSGSDAASRATASNHLADNALKLAQEFPEEEPRLGPPPQPLILDPKLAATPVPDLTGMSSQAAEATLKRFGLILGDAQRRESLQRAGTVVDQAPKAGSRAVRGTRVNIVLAQPASTVSVPDLSGMIRGNAEEALKDNRLGARYAGDQESDRRAGTVTSQSPRAGSRVPPRTVVQFWLAKPFPMMSVPDLKGMNRPDAERTLARNRLRPEPAGEKESDTPAGSVVDQLPPAGETVKPGTVVKFWLAKPVILISVPNLFGMSHEEADATLRQPGLEPGGMEKRESDLPAGTVLDQRPAEGELVKPGTRVDLVLARPSSVVPVPDLIGMSHSHPAAIPALLQEAGLQLGAVALRDSDQPAETILEQAPVAGSLVERGALVNLIVARLPATSASSWPLFTRGTLFMAAAVLVLASVTLVLRKSARSKQSASKPAMRVIGTKDIGRQEIFSKSPAITLELRLRGRRDQSSQTLAMHSAQAGGNDNGRS